MNEAEPRPWPMIDPPQLPALSLRSVVGGAVGGVTVVLIGVVVVGPPVGAFGATPPMSPNGPPLIGWQSSCRRLIATAWAASAT